MTEELKLTDKVSKIKGVGQKKAERLAVMGIETVGDLLEHYPFRYSDRRTITPALYADQGSDTQVAGRLLKCQTRPLSGRRSITECVLRDNTCAFTAVFFNMPYLKQTLSVGKDYVLYGRMRIRNGSRIWTNPEIAEAGSEKDRRGIIPVYRCTAGITNKDLRRWTRDALTRTSDIKEWISPEVVERNNLCDRAYAYRNIHFPASEHHYKAARFRLTYEQLLMYQLSVRSNRKRIVEAIDDASVGDVPVKPFIDALPFELTEGQKACITDIERDMVSHKPMNRLVQGDVGCGKTVVAEAAIYKCVKAGHQAAMMAPTEILARQHMARLDNDLSKFGIKCSLLVNGMKASEKKAALESLRNGETDVLIGTHSVIGDNVEFSDLALAITDEQHRFGVNQRKKLVRKGRGVNVCVMSATPIPRTLAATVFGDMDFSIIKNKPAGRKEIITRSYNREGRERAYTLVRKELEKGNRAYVIAPSIESDDNELESAEGLRDELRARFKGYRVGLLHGRLGKDEKEAVMADFASGRIDILAATVVIEVGIDVPEATVIVIENAERFGLATLHQLRGRVGRSDMQSYCCLISYSKSETAAARIKAMTEMSDGFEISEEDYRLRGPGDIAGTMQSGSLKSGILSLCANTRILELAVSDAAEIAENPQGTDLSYAEKYMQILTESDNSDII